MQLPEALQPRFIHPTLLIASDTVHARFFLIGGDSLEELEGISKPREPLLDEKTLLADADRSQATVPVSDVDDSPRLHAFVHELIEHTSELVNSQGIAHIHLAMPAEMEHAFIGHLEQHLAAKIGKRVHHDLMRMSPLEIVERVMTE